MPKKIAPLTDVQIRTAKPQAKDVKLFDGGGLFLQVTPSGGKLWQLKYRFEGKEKLLALGAYPAVTLQEARKRREDAKTLLANGADPGAVKKAQKASKGEANPNSFEVVAREWAEKHSRKWVENHAEKTLNRLERDLFPWIGNRPIAEITAPELLKVLQRIEERGAPETARRAMQNCSQIFRYAIATARANRDTAADLRGSIARPKVKHRASITDPKKIGGLLKAIEGYEGTFPTKCALKLAPMLFVRPGELRNAEWSEFDIEAAEWRIPAARMKMREQHIVPLSRQALAILQELHPLTGRGRYVFPGARTNGRPMSNNTVNAALRRLGYPKDEITGHGFRSMASTLLNEQGWNRDAIERQLAHAERDEVRAAYNYAEHLPERRKMMQKWADYLDALKAGGQVIAFRREAG